MSPAARDHRPPARRRVKRLIEAIASALAMPTVLRHRLARRLLGAPRAMQWVSERVAHWPGTRGVLMRAAVYRRALDHLGRDVHIGYGTLLSKPQARLGDGAYLGRHGTVGWVDIGPHARIADGVQLLSGNQHHAGDDDHVALTPIAIGARAWIGANAVVMADVGHDAVVGAGAVVTRPVAPGQVVGGVPARPLPQRPRTAA